MNNLLRVMVVEDDAHWQDIICQFLSRLECDVKTFGDGATALDHLMQDKLAPAEPEPGRPHGLPDLILMDVMLPGLDGFEVCRRIRLDETLREIPIILVTALNDRNTRLNGFRAGADDFLTKPVDTEELRLRVRNIARLNRFRRLIAERERVAQISELAPDGILIIDTDYCIKYQNLAARSLLGHNSALPVASRQFRELLHPLHCDQTLRLLQEAWDGSSGATTCNTELVDAQGQSVPVELNIRPVVWESQACLQIHLHDLRDRRRLESQFLRLQRLEAVGSMAAGIAHDFGNLLTPMIAGADILLNALEGKPEQRLLQSTLNSAARGAKLVENLLAFTRGLDGSSQIVSLRYLVEEMRVILRGTCGPGVDFRTQICRPAPAVVADPTEIHQLVMNLCVNALDSMPEGGTLELKVSEQNLDEMSAAHYPGAHPGQWACISVSDTGCGMTPDQLAHIFEPFYTTKPVGKGTGLGLFTVRNILRKHNGVVRVLSEQGLGTTFEVLFPAHEDRDPAAHDQAFQEASRGQGELILLVDDEASNAMILSAMLSCWGYRVVCAHDGAQGLALFCKQPRDFRLIITDLMMPFMDGVALIHAARQLQPNVPALIISAAADSETRIKRLAPNLPLLLQKPIRRENLLSALRTVLEDSCQ